MRPVLFLLSRERPCTVVEEGGVRLRLSITDTPGFGDCIDNTQCWRPLKTLVEARYSSYLEEELKVNRNLRVPDPRMHVCVYFIDPTGHRYVAGL